LGLGVREKVPSSGFGLIRNIEFTCVRSSRGGRHADAGADVVLCALEQFADGAGLCDLVDEVRVSFVFLVRFALACK
jgi:hypothetical protein